MEPIHIFYKELPADENNIFNANITEKNEVENARFKKSLEYAVTGLSVNQDIGSALVTLTDIGRQNFLSNTIQKLVKEKNDPDLDLEISNPETKDIIIPFPKRSETDCPAIKLTFYNTMTKFYNYFQHIQKFGFVWEYSLLDSRYSIDLSKDRKI